MARHRADATHSTPLTGQSAKPRGAAARRAAARRAAVQRAGIGCRPLEERLGIAGSGEIAWGLAALAAPCGEVLLWARSDRSAARARDAVRASAGEDAAVRIETDPAVLEKASFVVEAIVEDHDVKVGVLLDLHRRLADDAVLA